MKLSSCSTRLRFLHSIVLLIPGLKQTSALLLLSKPSCSSTTSTIPCRRSILYSTAADSVTTPSTTITTVPSFSKHHHHQKSLTTIYHNIYTTYDWLNATQAATCLRLAYDHATATGCWDFPDIERHVNYATCDFAVEDCSPLVTYLQEQNFTARVFSALREWYNVSETTQLEFLDLFCAHYRGKDDDRSNHVMDRLAFHRDGSLLSFTITLTPPDQFTGGGTVFDCLSSSNGSSEEDGVLRPHTAGGAVAHVGKLLHGASPVLAGNRTVLVGFVDVLQPPSITASTFALSPLARACRDWGRMDKLEREHKKHCNDDQIRKTAPTRWLPRGSSCFPGGVSIPLFRSNRRRSTKGFQRRFRLEAEDLLLRSLDL